MTTIELPVSIGEALDKLSILEIKLEKIQDQRRLDVQKEYDAIYTNLAYLFTEDAKFHYRCLKEVNLKIWEDQDIFRESLDAKQREELCMKIIEENDRRFHIKKKLNRLFDSALQEQKGYEQKTAFFFGHLGLGDMIGCMGLIRYLSTKYDLVRVVCFRRNYNTFQSMVSDDPVIQPYVIDSLNELRINDLESSLERFKSIVGNAHVYCAGEEVFGKEPEIYYIPFCFYDDCKIPREMFWSYFHIAFSPEAKELAHRVEGIEYAFIHSQSSNGPLFHVEVAESLMEKSKDDVLIIDCNKNVYEEGHKWYDLAQQFVNRPMSFYTNTLSGASYICVSDSSLFCMAIHMDIPNAKQCWYLSRSDENYSYYFNDEVVKYTKNFCSRQFYKVGLGYTY